ncbi:MAG TPA: aromatic amino acid hydroxylase, partial [Holophagaceae bacterium]|nr:aromatic amino acid hydroxylase [Holophagaceae bacterium]
MTPTERAIAKLPRHLRRYVVSQSYGAYTPRDQAVWRHILHRLTDHLRDKAHPVYLEGLEATGIGLERIPSLDEMNEKLARLGWSAVAVRGFLPPAVFTELQTMKVLAIAEDIRDHSHIAYTPAPDIVHESAGHAPILANARYAEYVRRCGQVGFKAIASLEDQAVFEAIRNLSVVKEDPTASELLVKAAEQQLAEAGRAKRVVSENTKASRLYWWTAEYGLIGDLDHPKIYGAGLLSSLGEAAYCLTKAVKKLPLSLACVETEYDITTMQPQLFVARDFDHLFEVLDAFEATLAWKRGGDFGLRQALEARTVNHLRLSDGTEITGIVEELGTLDHEHSPGLRTIMARLKGPILVSRDGLATSEPFHGDAVVLFGDPSLHDASLDYREGGRTLVFQ